MKTTEVAKGMLEILQTTLAWTENSGRKNAGNFGMELIILKKQPITLRINPDNNHSRPHFHLDYGREFHSASICITTSEILAGNIPSKYRATIFNWLSKNKEQLLEIWNNLKAGGDASELLLTLE